MECKVALVDLAQDGSSLLRPDHHCYDPRLRRSSTICTIALVLLLHELHCRRFPAHQELQDVSHSVDSVCLIIVPSSSAVCECSWRAEDMFEAVIHSIIVRLRRDSHTAACSSVTVKRLTSQSVGVAFCTCFRTVGSCCLLEFSLYPVFTSIVCVRCEQMDSAATSASTRILPSQSI
jgi:hypothetical protein